MNVKTRELKSTPLPLFLPLEREGKVELLYIETHTDFDDLREMTLSTFRIRDTPNPLKEDGLLSQHLETTRHLRGSQGWDGLFLDDYSDNFGLCPGYYYFSHMGYVDTFASNIRENDLVVRARDASLFLNKYTYDQFYVTLSSQYPKGYENSRVTLKCPFCREKGGHCF